MAMHNPNSSYLMYFLAGFTAGVAAGVLIAPVSGSEVRGTLAHSGKEYIERTRELYDKGRRLADEAAAMFDEGRRLVEGQPV
jgi:gas vesicle protein